MYIPQPMALPFNETQPPVISLRVEESKLSKVSNPTSAIPIPAMSSLRSRDIPGVREAGFGWGAGFTWEERLDLGGVSLVVVGLRLEVFWGWRVVLDGVLSVDDLLDLFFVPEASFLEDDLVFLLAMDISGGVRWGMLI
jgi:hypothetical protein